MIAILVRPEHTEEDRNGDYQLYGLTTKRFAKKYIFGIWGCLHIYIFGIWRYIFGIRGCRCGILENLFGILGYVLEIGEHSLGSWRFNGV